MKINFPLLALAIGAFGIGTTEFSPMGLLPVIAKGVDVSIPVGNADQCVCHRRHGRRTADDAAVVASRTAQCADFSDGDLHRRQPVVIHRAGLHHAAAVAHYYQPQSRRFFGPGSVVAASVVPKHKQASAVATMFMGLTIANIGGVPAATAWRNHRLADVLPCYCGIRPAGDG